MNNMREYDRVFAKGTPTAFIIESPFHLLCTLEAIKEFEISDYCLVLVLEKDNIRNKQLFSMLRERNLEYDIYYEEEAVQYKSIVNNKRYDRVMLGDYDDLNILRMCLVYASTNATPIFMDDGISSIMILKELPYKHTPVFAKIREWVKGPIGLERARRSILREWETAGIKDYNYFFTIYSEIKSKKFIVYPNNFAHILEQSASENPGVVIIVGTVIDIVASRLGLSTALIEGIIWDKLVEVRNLHPKAEIIYVPHGRDTNCHIEQLCGCLQIRFVRLDKPIENYVIDEKLNVEAIYGYTSTALSTLKAMTNAPVVHWVIRNKHGESWYLTKQYIKYYEQMGMRTEMMWIPEMSWWEHMKKTIIKYACKK